MSQSDFGILDPYVDDGVILADDLNSWRDAVHTGHRGSARPGYVQAGMIWENDAASSWIINLYSGATMGDLPLFTVDTVNGTVTLAAAMQAVTQTSGNSSTAVATTSFVQQAVNTAINIALAQIYPVGTLLDLVGLLTTAPAGWVLARDGTIGSQFSPATIRANNDCQPLYEHLWNNLAQTEAPVTGGRGANAVADFNANKPIGGLDFRGVTKATYDRLGGTPANRLTTFARVGQIGGEEYHALTVAEMAQHTHGLNWSDPGHAHHTYGWDAGLGGSGSGNVLQDGYAYGQPGNISETVGSGISASVQYNGSSAGHYNTQPTRTVTTIIKL